jgi:integrase
MPRARQLCIRTIRQQGREQFVVDLRAFGGRRRVFDSVTAAQEALLQAELHRTPKPGVTGSDPAMTVAEVAVGFLKAKRRKAGQTYRRYKSDLEVHILPRFGEWQWRQLDRGSAIVFLDELRTSPIIRYQRGIGGRLERVLVPGQRSPATIRGVLATLSALASYAVDVHKLGEHNPFLRLAKTLDLQVTPASRRARIKKKVLTPAHVERLLARAAQESGHWVRPMLVCFLRACPRLGEVLALRPEDVELSIAGRETLRIERQRTVSHDGRALVEPPKTDAGNRTLRLSPQVAAEFRRWIEVDRPAWKLKAGWRTLPPWLFFADVDPATYAADDPAAGMLTPGNVRRTIRRLTTALHAEDVAAGVPRAEQFPATWTPHGGRHTVATHLLQAGRPADSVRQLLGHESIRTTADVYGRGHDPAATAGLLETLDALAPVPPLTDALEPPRRRAKRGRKS